MPFAPAPEITAGRLHPTLAPHESHGAWKQGKHGCCFRKFVALLLTASWNYQNEETGLRKMLELATRVPPRGVRDCWARGNDNCDKCVEAQMN